MNLPAYPKYKPSGVEWLGDVPEHWITKKLGYEARLQGGFAFKSEIFDSEGVPVIQMNSIRDGRLDLDQAKRIPESETVSEFALCEGDILMGMTGSLENIAVVSEDDLPAQLNQRVGRFITSQKLADRYLWFVIQSAPFREQVYLSASGTAQLNISSSQVEALVICQFPLNEQDRIADFLDERTGKLDALAEKKRGLIEKLKEKRSALISRTVTKGLPPEAAAQARVYPQMTQISADEESGKPSAHLRSSAKSADHFPKLKPSGIDWLGDIPEHWEIQRSKNLFRLFGGYAFSSEGFSKDEDEFPALVTPGSFAQEGGLQFPEGKTTYFVTDYPKAFDLQVGDLLIVLTDLSYKKLILGRCVLVDRNGLLLNQRVAKLLVHDRAKDRIDRRFLIYVLNSPISREQLIQTATGTTVFHSSPTKVGESLLALPPRVEQTAIVNYLDRETAKIDRMIEKVEAALEKLAEYRAALITAAVTGKIDVRKVAA